MTRIRISFFGNLRKIVGDQVIQVDAENLYEALVKLSSKYGDKIKNILIFEDGRFRAYHIISVNGVNVTNKNAHEITLSDGDIVYILPPVGGG